MNPTRSGYADVNGIKLYHEIYGEGEPLVLIHGGLTTIGEMQGWVQPLAKARRVIAVEMQGHGRTADTDRPMSFTTLGDDIAVLLDHLEIPKADLVGHPLGGASAIRPQAARVQLLPLLSAVELADHPRYIGLRFAIRRHTMVLVYRCRPGVIGGQRQRQVIVILHQQRIQIRCAPIDVLICAKAVGHA